ncbi:Signal transduction response regulator, receiver region domain protein [Candidatus Magnetomorum sp. HK-1]|nr:Signal transduction response regulator, receiver region domain protein [Candidatus Magnetomorum sp. HK-1]
MLKNKPYILIVEDKSVELNFYNFFLRNAQFQTDCFIDPYAALESFNPDLHDIVLLDICMPMIDGFDLAKQIIKKDPNKNIPIIFVSSLDKNEQIRKGFQCGGIDYIQKPVDYTELINKIMIWVQHKKKVKHIENNKYEKEIKIHVQKKRIQDLQKKSRTLVNEKKMINHHNNTHDIHSISENVNIQLQLLGQKNLSFNERNKIIDDMEMDLSCSRSEFIKKLQDFQLTTSEKKIAILIKAGLRTKEIIQVLNLSINTIETHRKSIRYKLGIRKSNIDLIDYLNSLSVDI